MAMTKEDARLVAAAANDGRISPDTVLQWMNAIRADPVGTRKSLASLRSVRRDVLCAAGIDPDLEETHQKFLQRVANIGIRVGNTGIQAPRPVVAASHQDPGPSSGVAVDMLGIPIPQVPPPVRISKGTPPEQWTERQIQDAHLRRLGPRFHPGTEPPPKGDEWFQPSGNEPFEFVPNADGNGGHWREKPNYQAKG